MATISTGIKGLKETFTADVKSSNRRIKHLNTLMHLIVQTYLPDLTKPSNVQNRVMQTNIFF